MVTTVGFPAFDPFREWREQHRRIVESMKLSETLALSQFADAQRRMDEYFEPLRRLKEEVARFNLAALVGQEELQRWNQAQRQLARDLQTWRDLYAPHFEALARFTKQNDEIFRAMRQASLGWTSANDRVMRDFAVRLSRQVEADLALTGVSNASVERVLALSGEEMARLSPEQRRALDPLALIGILLTLLFGVWTIVADIRAAEVSKDALRNVATELEEQGQVIESLSEGLRALVSAALETPDDIEDLKPSHTLSRSLHLRRGPSTSDESLGAYPPGTSVQAVFTLDAWTAVMVPSPSGEGVLLGWMSSRYLKPLN